MQSLFVGVDGGATKSVVRVEDESGNLLGRAVGGPASIRLSVTQAWHSIVSCLQVILNPLGISIKEPLSYRLYGGMGLAGCELSAARENFLSHPHPFTQLVVTSDAHTACLGAHNGKNGAIIIIGTGVVGYQILNNDVDKVGGWGFPHDDQGGGAWLGMQAIRHCFKLADGRMKPSLLAATVIHYFSEDFKRLTAFANEANSSQFALLAPLVIKANTAGCKQAELLLQKAAHFINEIGQTLHRKALNVPFQCALVGGIAPFIEPHLETSLRSYLVPCCRPPEEGAIIILHQERKRWQ